MSLSKDILNLDQNSDPLTRENSKELPKISNPVSSQPYIPPISAQPLYSPQICYMSNQNSEYYLPNSTMIYPQIYLMPNQNYYYYPQQNAFENTLQNEEMEILYGKLKFFDETQNYGFFVLETGGSDLFVHYDDFLKSGITLDYIRLAKQNGLRFSFKRMKYFGKYEVSYKAVEITILEPENMNNEGVYGEEYIYY